uniref:kinetochore-associated protein 1-like n=2 Tax=Myxine glutinosa TaxID=7769 RepID=UPI00358F6F97
MEDIFGGVGVKKCQALDNLLFLLDDHNLLSVWDAYSLIMVSYWPHMPMQDFNLFSDSESNSVENVSLKLVMLTLPDGEKPVYLQVYSFVGMELLYFLEVTNPSFLVNAPTGQDIIHFIEGNYDRDCRPPTGCASSLHLRCLTEALPENRLSRLLHKHEFEEAETFAIEFGLAVELVYKMKLNVLVEKLQMISPTVRLQKIWLDYVEEACRTLQKIQDISFIVHYCLDTCWPSFDVAVKMLQFAKTRLHCRKDYGDGLTALMSKAQERLTTFIGAFVADHFDGLQWHSFLNSTDLFSEVLHHLSSANIDRAQFIWLRHQVEIEQRLDATKLKMLLVAITPGTLFSGLQTLLKCCIAPLACFRVPGGRTILARWLEREVRNMEITEKSGWPENGLKMLEVFFNISEFSSSELLSHREAFIEDDIMVQLLQNLLQSLRKLLHLHRQYNCFLLLSEFENESTVAIAFHMLDRATAPQLVPGIVERYVIPYLAEHDIPEEKFFLQYITYLLEHHSVRSTSLFETASEAKAMTVLDCMSDTDLVLDAVQQIMLKAVVPWSKSMEQLVQKYLHMEHPKYANLKSSGFLLLTFLL